VSAVVVIEAEAVLEVVEQLADEELALVVLEQVEMGAVVILVVLVERNSSHFEVEPSVLDLSFLHETYLQIVAIVLDDFETFVVTFSSDLA